MPRFVHLHCHTEFSLIDGLVRIKPLIKAAQAAQMPACAMTDFSNLYGLVQFYKAANSAGIKPIIGADVVIDNGSEPASRLVLLCQNHQGYVNLSELVSLGYLEGQKKDVPHIQREWFEGRSGGLIALSAGRLGDIGQALLASHYTSAQQHLQFWKAHFPNRFYLELQRTGRAQEEQYIHAAVQLAIETQTPVVATNDVVFLKPDDYEAHEVRVCIHDGYVLDDSRRPHLYTPQQYLRTPEEMADLFSDIPEAIENTWRIAQRCNIELTLGKNYLPDFPVPEGMTMDQYFCDLSRQGLDYRFQTVLKDKLPQRQEYDERLQIELDVILQMGFPGYFLIVADFIQWSKDNGVPVGPGRGSGAGSIVAYALKITDLDPIEYDLLFERFLNPERVSMPDFDVDFCMEGRDRVIQYVAKTYGKKHVSQIITFGTMAAKAVVRDVGRVLGHPYPFVDQISKMIPFEIGITLSKALEQEEQLNQRYQNDEEVTALIDMALKLEGLNRNVGTHAGGVVIGPSELTDFCPLYWDGNPDNTMVTQLDKNDVESIGLVKFDFLGLRTLTIIKWALENIVKVGGEAPDMLEIPLDDKASFDLLKNAQTTAVFQLESRGMKELIKRLLPDCFEDIIALVALFRPGPLQSGMVDDFINRKHGRAEIEYPHPDLEPVLKPTYGIILYQEQVMQISQVLANYTLGGADILRRCLAGSTQIIDAATGQYATLQQVADDPEYWLGREVFSLDLETQKITTKPISAIYPNGTREVWEITTKTNKKIRATADHLFYTLVGWQPLADFKVGERIALAGRLAPAQNVNTISNAQIKLIAYLLGDGHLSTKKPSSSYFCNTDTALIEDFKQCANTLFNKIPPTDEQLHEGKKTVIYVRIGFISAFNQWIDQHVQRAHSRDKLIPDWVFSLSEKQLQLFLGTLWSTDGSFDTSIGHTDYTSTSEQLIIQIQQLLLRLGIIGLFNIKRIQYKNQPHISYRAQITGREEMEKFQYIIAPFLSEAKQQKALLCQQKIQAKTYNQSKHSLPPQAMSLIGAEKHRIGLTWSQIDQAAGRKSGTMSSGMSFKGKPTRCLSRQRVRYFAQALQSQKLQAIANSDVFWDEITDIQLIGQEAVFDLSIPDTHNFVANDFIAHNCMGKKKPEEMAQQRDIFMKGSAGRDVDGKIATYVFDLMEKFAGYGFNKSHSAAYAFVSYQTAWLKAHYPAAFMAAVLSSDMDNTDKVVGLMDDCREMKLTVKSPHVNYCDHKFTIEDNNTILYGLGAIKGVGENAIENIVQSRKENDAFNDLFDFCKKIDLRKVNRRVLEALVKSGCFDNMGVSRAVSMKSLDTAIKLAEKHASDKNTGQNSLFGMFDAPQEQAEEKIPYAENVTEWTDIQRLNGEKDCLGLYLTGHPIDQYRDELKNFSYTTLSKVRPTNRGSTAKVIGLVLGVRIVNSRRGKMAIVQLDDNTGRLDATMYSTLYTESQTKLEKDTILVLEGEVKDDEYSGGFSMTVNSVMTFPEAREKSAKYLTLQITGQQIQTKFTNELLSTLQSNQGRCPIVVKYKNNNIEVRLRLGEQWSVMPSDDFIGQLEKLIGKDCVSIDY